MTDMTNDNVIPFYKPPVKALVCSFCNTPEAKVRKLFSNGQPKDDLRHICDRCAIHAKERMK